MMDARWTAVLCLLSASVLVMGGSLPQRLREAQAESSWPCPQSPAHPGAALSVHSVRPADVSVLSAVGLPHTPGTVESVIMTQLHELMTFFSPEVISLSPNEAKSSLRLEAEEAALLLNQQPTHAESRWKLLLLFVPIDRQCLCSEQISVLVKEVDAALQVLHSQLKKVIVSVVLLDTQSESGSAQSRTCPCSPVQSTRKLRLTTAIYSHVLLESLEKHLLEKKWYSDRDDFTVQLQRVPLSDLVINPDGRASQEKLESQTDELVLQLWGNLLQSTGSQKNSGQLKIQCPSEDHPFIRTERNSPGRRPEPRVTIDPVMGTEVPCTDMSPSNTIPTSVHEVRPADIRVVAALGDSLTAGNGVGAPPGNVLDVLTQYRGLSWSIGGDQNISTVTTIANILREFNPSVTGFSVGIGGEESPRAFLNQAVPGAQSDDMLTQARAVVDILKTDSRINFHSDWKLITLFIGGNDLCDSCQNTLYHSPENFVRRIQEGLDYLHQEVPRAIVNLVQVLHITPLRELHQDPAVDCPTWLVRILCPCVVLPEDGSKALEDLENLNRADQQGLVDLVESGRYDTHSNFTVVLQPFLKELTLPHTNDGHPDNSYFTPDCFHLSQKSHTLMARGLWNNMLEPLGSKTDSHDFESEISLKCPSENSTFIRTYENSNYTYAGPPPPPPPISNWGSDFSCADTAPSGSVPTSVHRLRPADIKVVAALGDSITTAFGAKAQKYNELKTEYVGVSWSIGGDAALETATTLPNILRKFNPAVQGFSTGEGSATKGFNMAVSGAQTPDLLAQTKELIQALKSSQGVDFESDWKLITLLIGTNDVCYYCMDQYNLSPQNYSRHLAETLDLLYKEVPRVLVNIVPVPEMEGLRKIKKNTLTCKYTPSETCPCVASPDDNSVQLTKLRIANRQYQSEAETLISGGRYDGRDDFAVVLQPYFQNTVYPALMNGSPDLSFFSIDCLHLSERAHAEMAVALWNNMLEPVGMKQRFNNFTYDRTKIQCPSEAQPFIYTKKNSIPDSGATTVAPETTAETTDPPTTPKPTNPPTTPKPTNPPITPKPTDPPTTPEPSSCSSSVPVWVPVVVAFAGLLLGVGGTWFFMRKRIKKIKKSAKHPKEKEAELKASSL